MCPTNRLYLLFPFSCAVSSHQLFVLHTVVYIFAVVKALGPSGTFQHRERGPWGGGGGAQCCSLSFSGDLFSFSFCGGGTFIFLSPRGLVDPHSLLLSDPRFCCLHLMSLPTQPCASSLHSPVDPALSSFGLF